MDARLTIIVPVYNRATIVERTLDSIAVQSLRPLNLIIVDNNSTDDTVEVLERWASARRSSSFNITLLSESRPGAAAARNCGLRAATTPYVMFFDSDDVMDSNLCADIVGRFDADSSLDLVGWDVEMIDLDGKSDIKKWSPRHLLYNHLVHTRLATQRYAARRELFVKAGGWNPDVMAWNDYELGVRILTQRPRVSYLGAGARVKIYSTPVSITLDSSRSLQGMNRKAFALDCCEKALREGNFLDMVPWIDMRRVLLAADYRRLGYKDEPKRLLNDVISRRGPLMKLLYLKQLIYPRGAHLLCPFPRL